MLGDGRPLGEAVAAAEKSGGSGLSNPSPFASFSNQVTKCISFSYHSCTVASAAITKRQLGCSNIMQLSNLRLLQLRPWHLMSPGRCGISLQADFGDDEASEGDAGDGCSRGVGSVPSSQPASRQHSGASVPLIVPHVRGTAENGVPRAGGGAAPKS